MNIAIADLHCHPTMKPYGRSFPGMVPGTDPLIKDSIYYYGKPPLIARLLNRMLGLTIFPQASIQALEKGGVGLVFCSLYPFEKGFARKGALPGDLVSDGVNLVAGIGRNRIHFIQDEQNGYFDDLENEYAFLKALDGKVLEIGTRKLRYVLLRNFSQMEVEQVEGIFTVYIGLSFEGMHSLYDRFPDIGSDDLEVAQSLLVNLGKVKSWEHCPLFITFAHHFYNGLCGHASSLTDFSVRLITDQSYMLGEGINLMGKQMIRGLLEKESGKRILIDIKHMSIKARTEYFDLLDQEFANENIPVIVSHGAIRGDDHAYNIFLSADINFSDNELVKIGKSKGLFGIQLDERRIASSHEIALFKRNLGRKRILLYAALLVWRQIEYIAVLMDINRLPAWDIQCIGSDNDGIVNPIDGVWTSGDFLTLKQNLLVHATSFVDNPRYSMSISTNLITADEIVEKFMNGNMIRFLNKNFK
ncbi:membrane dipeptidase [Pedobacter sp. PLR]|uniref:membrane dipeptidase n=1 Tax=Pedobacter sp. PLR TaxID=2994465 RepID=UPI0022465DAC|nr:membrane dipeptidase [Pedobacter sp. PLR]MCX2454324.1 membrane dipeptidase [Pedobacter sp. PLR]